MRAMCGVQLRGRKRSTALMFMLGLSETMDQFAMVNSVRWYGHLLRREDGHVFLRALDIWVEGQKIKEGRRGRGKRRLRMKVRGLV